MSLASITPESTENASTCAIGVDVGGTKIAAGVVAFPQGEITMRLIVPTLPQRGGEAVLDEVMQLITQLSTHAKAQGSLITGIGLGVCELVDLAGNIASAQTIPWQGVPLRERLAALGPVVVEADVRAAALAEALFGAGRPHRIFLYVSVGTGISSCLVVDGSPFLGARGATGTMASGPLGVVCEQCGTVESRTLEDIASGPALARRFSERTSVPVDSGEAVLAAANRGEPNAIAVVQSAGAALGAMIGWLVNVLDPDAIVVGGGLGLSGGIYWESLTDSVRKHIWSELHRDLPILPATTGRDAGVIGAAARASNTTFRSLGRGL